MYATCSEEIKDVHMSYNRPVEQQMSIIIFEFDMQLEREAFLSFTGSLHSPKDC